MGHSQQDDICAMMFSTVKLRRILMEPVMEWWLVMTRKPRQFWLPYFQNKNLAMTGVVKNIPTSGPTSLVMHIQTDQLIRRLGLGFVHREWYCPIYMYIYIHHISHDGSMVLLYMVLHESHQYTPVMLAFFYQHKPDPSWVYVPGGEIPTDQLRNFKR